jgi:hypothetical protein
MRPRRAAESFLHLTGRRPALVALMCAALACAALASPGTAPARLPAEGFAVDVPGYASGPVITDAGLVWEGEAGITLLAPDGSSRQLAPLGAPNWDNLSDLAWFGSAWWALARSGGVFGGPIGGRLRPLLLPRRCSPASGIVTAQVRPQLAVSGPRLFAALPAWCLAPRRAAPYGELEVVDLRTGRASVLAALPGEPRAIGAGGGRVALAYDRVLEGPGPGVPVEQVRLHRVEVWSARTGRELAVLKAPLGVPIGKAPRASSSTGAAICSCGQAAARAPLVNWPRSRCRSDRCPAPGGPRPGCEAVAPWRSAKKPRCQKDASSR